MYQFFAPTQIKPQGWLRRQLELQANGLVGHLDQIWEAIRCSAWVGGEEDGWERVPYWLDGFVPMAYLLDDPELKKKADWYMNTILDRQQENGCICPPGQKDTAGFGMWTLFLFGKVLTMYCEFLREDPDRQSEWERADRGLYRAMEYLYTAMKDGKVVLFGWDKYRWFESFISLQYLYDRTHAEWIVELGRMIREQGGDYPSFTETWKRPLNKWAFYTHIVNIAMMFKYEAVCSVLFGEEYMNRAEELWRILETYNGTAAGCFTGDECLSGISNTQGTELCSVNELMYSMEILYSVTGDPVWADRLEKAAFNALPATISDDMWTHQYDQQVNQIACQKFPGRSHFRSNNGDAHLFGLAPHFCCCTVNMGQGWPKLTMSAFQKRGSDIECIMMLPAVLETNIADKNVRVSIETDYPFRLTGTYFVETDEPVTFTLYIRVPGWAKGCIVNGEKYDGRMIEIKKEWNEKEEIRVEWIAAPVMKDRPTGLKTVEYGPLVYALPIETKWVTVENSRKDLPYCDYELIPQSEWRYGFASSEFVVEERSVDAVPFSSKSPAVMLHTKLAPVEWDYEDGFETVAAVTPVSDKAVGDACDMTLIPYGCAKLRMTEMPVVTVD